MFFLCFAPFVLLIHLSKETNADGAVNEACNAGACTDTENTVCDTVTRKCPAKTCTDSTNYCVTGATCDSTTSPCECGGTFTATSTGLCELDVLQSCAAPNGANCNTGLTCDTTDNKCRYKAGSTCTTGVDRCVSGATCDSLTAQCTCNTAAYTNKAGTGICEANAKKVGGSCTAGVRACDDPNASCINSTCVCNAGYQVKLADATCSGAMGLVVSTFLLFASFLVKAQF